MSTLAIINFYISFNYASVRDCRRIDFLIYAKIIRQKRDSELILNTAVPSISGKAPYVNANIAEDHR